MVRNGEILRILSLDKTKFFCRKELQKLTGEQNTKNVQSHIARLIKGKRVELKLGNRNSYLIRHKGARR